MRGGAVVTVLALASAVVVAVAVGIKHADLPDFFGGPECVADVGGHEVRVDPEQAGNAALIAAISVQRGMPARAASIALATAFQESKLRNVDYGDRDSLGLFQQRPSQGWGDREEILDPVHATNAFYDALERVDGYEDLAITVAAQEVQRSGFPEAYADHEADARALASALTGHSPAALTCTLDDEGEGNGDGDVDLVRSDVAIGFGSQEVARVPGGVSLPIDRDADGRTRGWAVAQYLVARAESLHVVRVRFDGHAWTRSDGWRTTDDGRTAVRVDLVA